MLTTLRSPGYRSPIDVAILENGQVLIQNDAIAILDRDGTLEEDLTIHEFPAVFQTSFSRLLKEKIEPIILECAIIISDRFPIINIAHNLYDHMTRIALYNRAGVDISKATVIGPEMRTGFQKKLAQKFGIEQFLSTNRTALVKAQRLFVSSNCRDLRHPAHEGSGWAIEAVRKNLGGATCPGNQRIYVSRSDAGARRITNEAEVIAILSKYGFRVVVLGQMDYDEQIEAFVNASSVVGPHGAGMCHIALCAPGTTILEIFHPVATPSGIASLAFETGLRYSALIGYDGKEVHPHFNDPEHLDPNVSYLNRDIRVDISELNRWINDTLH